MLQTFAINHVWALAPSDPLVLLMMLGVFSLKAGWAANLSIIISPFSFPAASVTMTCAALDKYTHIGPSKQTVSALDIRLKRAFSYLGAMFTLLIFFLRAQSSRKLGYVLNAFHLHQVLPALVPCSLHHYCTSSFCSAAWR